MLETLPFDWFILLLRVLFIFLLYFFLYQVVRVTSRELVALASASSSAGQKVDPRASGRLVLVDPGQSDLAPGISFGLRPSTIVGRHPDCDIVIDEPFVSAEHAEVAFEQGRWWVHDLGSTNGTFVNGNPTTVPTGLKPGDTVQFGRITMQLAP